MWVEIPNEELKVGDTVNVLGRKVITKLYPYRGPLTDIIFALADTNIGCGFSLEKKGYTETWRAE